MMVSNDMHAYNILAILYSAVLEFTAVLYMGRYMHERVTGNCITF